MVSLHSTGPVTRAIAAMGREPEPARRGTLRALAALPLAVATLTVPAAALPSPDAALLALRPAFLAAVAEEGPLRTEYRRIRDLAEASVGPAPILGDQLGAWGAWANNRLAETDRLDIDGVFDLWCDAASRLQEIIDRMADISATTLEGACFKAMAVEHDEVIGERVIADLLAMGGRA